MLDERDCNITTFRASGPGGQHRNTTDSAVRVLHRPTGMVVVAQRSRSQHQNRQHALDELERRLRARERRAAPRIATRPSRTQKKRRLESKRQHSEKKARRRPPRWD